MIQFLSLNGEQQQQHSFPMSQAISKLIQSLSHLQDNSPFDILKTLSPLQLCSIFPQMMSHLITSATMLTKPQLRNIFESFLLNMCKQNFQYYLIVKIVQQIRWYYKSYYMIWGGKNLLERIETAAINGKDPTIQLKQTSIDQYVQYKQYSCQYNDNILFFYKELIKSSLDLHSIPKEQKLTKLKQNLQNINRVLQNNRTKCQHYNRFLGIIFPFNNTNEFIVRIIEKQTIIFPTKARTLYLVFFQTISLQDLKHVTNLTQYKGQQQPTYILNRKSSNYSLQQKYQSYNNLAIFQQVLSQGQELSESNISNSPRKQVIQNTPIHIINFQQNQALCFQHSYFGQLWKKKQNILMAQSTFKNIPSLKIHAYIVKVGDDMRKEFIAMQIIELIKEIFMKEKVDVWLKPYKIIVYNQKAGFIECLKNTLSIDNLKKYNKGKSSLLQLYKQIFGNNLPKSILNFLKSLVGYSLIQYVLQIKDRHNGNILIDSQGHIIHIDYGFILCQSPGNLNFQVSQFKMTSDYINLLGGLQSQMFESFRTLFVKGLIALRNHAEQVISMINLLIKDCNLNCIKNLNVQNFMKRFMMKESDESIDQKGRKIINQCCNNRRASHYDKYQYFSNGIFP